MYKAHDEMIDKHIGVFADVDELKVGLMDYFDVSTYASQLYDVIAVLRNKLQHGYPVDREVAWLGISLERIF